ncbi:hypothetical protein [Legionella rubrilucens]|nr:hypothetical protein [Legionella rubrilucens]
MPLIKRIVLLLPFVFYFNSGYTINLIAYKQKVGRIELYFDESPKTAGYVILDTVPSLSNLKELKVKTIRFPSTDNKLIISFDPDKEPRLTEYSIVIFVDNNYMEFIRQSAGWLASNLNYSKPDGYTILGRSTLKTHVGVTKNNTQPVILIGKPDLKHLKPLGHSTYPEIRQAMALLHYLWEKPIRQGPINMSYRQFLTHSFEDKLSIIRKGGFSVMCQGMRDLFIHGSYGLGLKVRPVSALNYSPQLKDLIAYSHATAEVWVNELSKWVLFDPWLGIMVTTKEGIPLGASDLQASAKRPKNLRIVPVINKLRRMQKHNDNTLVYNNFYPRNVKLFDFSCNQQGCAPGYVQYFGQISIPSVKFASS